VEKVTRPYEVLVRLRPGGVEAAHVMEIEEIKDGDTVVAARELPAKPLALAGPEFGTLVNRINQTVLAERDALAAEAVDLKAEIARLKKSARA
jgi:hypothetical protein